MVRKRAYWSLFAGSFGKEKDWICVIENRENVTTVPGKAQIYGEMPVPSEVKKVFMW
ncbi:hypothetical protein [Neobacillus cucumis]|uniref:hypothetical protein n=1 Tax=Neobacillus cucumis TaxID=1740721 RepID=UPI0015E13899|nr:hypothetical protein [Neobacillus cucumis]